MTKARLPPLAMSSGTNCYSLGVLCTDLAICVNIYRHCTQLCWYVVVVRCKSCFS